MYLWVKPPRLVTPEHIYEIPERLTHTGAVQEPLDEAACIALLRHLQEQYFAVAEVQVPEGEETAAKLFRSLGFVQVDQGVSYVKG